MFNTVRYLYEVGKSMTKRVYLYDCIYILQSFKGNLDDYLCYLYKATTYFFQTTLYSNYKLHFCGIARSKHYYKIISASEYYITFNVWLTPGWVEEGKRWNMTSFDVLSYLVLLFGKTILHWFTVSCHLTVKYSS